MNPLPQKSPSPATPPPATDGTRAGDRPQAGARPGNAPDSAEEMEFMRALQAYKQSSGRMFPTWSEVLEVLLSLGYQKSSPSVLPPDR